MDMKGKTVLVTGAASGIGRCTALKYAEMGASQIACLDIHDASNRETVKLIEAAGARAIAVQVDLGKVADIRRAYAEVFAAFGRLDAAAHIGGYSWRGESTEITEEQWDMVINVNLRGTFFCCQEALKIMYAQGSGAIVNMSADAAFFPTRGFAVQAAGKGGIALMSRSLGFESAPRGVRVNAVSPGIVLVQPTGFAKPAGPEVKLDPRTPKLESVASLGKQTASGRWMEAEEVANTFVFLSSNAASGISADLLYVNCGGYPTLEF